MVEVVVEVVEVVVVGVRVVVGVCVDDVMPHIEREGGGGASSSMRS